jgi:DNA-directed RNA polymerase
MAFFRIKKIKGKEYAYVVENEWKSSKSLRGKKTGSRQKVRGYLGKVLRFELKEDTGFIDYFKITNLPDYIGNNEIEKIMKDLIEWELHRFAVNKNQVFVDLNSIKVQKGSRNIALMINNGMMCGLTLKNLLEFKAGEEQNDGYRLARAFVEAGITIPQEVFVGLFGKLHKNMEKQKSDFAW